MDEAMREATKKAVRIAGGQTALAKALGISRMSVHLWVKHGRVPAARVLDVERATEGFVTRFDLRPDLYPLGRR